MIMKQQGFNLRVLMSVVLPFSLFLVAAINGMEQQDGQQHNFNGSKTEQAESTEELTSQEKKEQDKRVKTAKMMAVASRNDDEYNNG